MGMGMSIMAGAMNGGATQAIDQVNILQADDLKTKQEKRLAEYREQADNRLLDRQQAMQDRADTRQDRALTAQEERQQRLLASQNDIADKRYASEQAKLEARSKADQARLEALIDRNGDTAEGKRAKGLLELAKAEADGGNAEKAASYRQQAAALLLPPLQMPPKPAAAPIPAGNSTAGAGRGEGALRDKTVGGMGTNLDIIDENIAEINRSIADTSKRTDMKPEERDRTVRDLQGQLASYTQQRERFTDKDGKPIMQRAVEPDAAKPAAASAKVAAPSSQEEDMLAEEKRFAKNIGFSPKMLEAYAKNENADPKLRAIAQRMLDKYKKRVTDFEENPPSIMSGAM